MPNLIYNLEFKIDKAQLAELKNIVDASTTAQVSTLTEKVKQLETQLDKLKNTQTGVSKTDQQRIKQSKTRESQLGALTKLAREQGKLSKDQIKSLKSLVGTEKEQGKVLLSNSLNEKKSLTSRKNLADQFRRSSTAVANATEVLEAFENQQEKTNQTVLGGDKSFSIANQTLFGFGDLAQDAAQFSQGAAQGFRAIGNNIAFNAEMFGLLVQKTGSAKDAFKTLGSQIFGTGGIILGINVIITAVTAGLTKFGKSSKEAANAVDDFISSSSDLRSVFDFDFLDISSLERQRDAINLLIPVVKNLALSQTGLATNNKILGRTYGSAASQALGTSDALVDQSDIVDELVEKFSGLEGIELEELRKKITDLNSELALRRALLELDPLAKFILETSQATEKTLLFSEATKLLTDLGQSSNEDIEKNVKGLQTRRKTLEQLIQKEIDLGLVNDASIAKFKSLQDQLNDVNSELQTQIDLMIKREKIAMDTAGIDAQTEAVRSQIKILNTKNEKDKIDLALEQKKTDITTKLNVDEANIRSLLRKKELTEEEAETRIKALQNKAQADSDLEALNASNAITELRKSDILAVTQAGAQGLESIVSFRNQEIDADIKAAKARGASAKEIEKLERKKFELNKKAQLGNAIINTAANVVEAKPPSPKAIAAGLLGAIQIATILKTKFGGGGGSAAGGGARSGGSGASIRSEAGGGSQRGFFDTSFVGRADGFDPDQIRQPSFDPSTQTSARNVIVLEGSINDELMAYSVKSGNAKIESGTTYLGD